MGAGRARTGPLHSPAVRRSHGEGPQYARGQRDPGLPQAGGGERHLRAAGRPGDPPVRRAPRRSGHPHLPGAPRAGRRAYGRRVREGHRPGRGLHGHLGAGGDQPGHADRRRLHGLGAAGGDHRPGRLHAGRHRRLPGGRHRRHHAADREALLPDQGRRRAAAGPRRGPVHRPVAAAPGRCWSTSASTSGRARSRTSPTPSRRCPATARPPAPGHPRQLEAAARALQCAERPVDLRRRRDHQRRGRGRADAPGRADRDPGQHHPDGPGRLPRHPPAVRRHAGDARHRGGHLRLPGVGRDPGRRGPLRRARAVDRHERVGPRRQDHPHRRRPGRDLQEPGRPHRHRRAGRPGAGRPGRGLPGPARAPRRRPAGGLGGADRRLEAPAPLLRRRRPRARSSPSG